MESLDINIDNQLNFSSEGIINMEQENLQPKIQQEEISPASIPSLVPKSKPLILLTVVGFFVIGIALGVYGTYYFLGEREISPQPPRAPLTEPTKQPSDKSDKIESIVPAEISKSIIYAVRPDSVAEKHQVFEYNLLNSTKRQLFEFRGGGVGQGLPVVSKNGTIIYVEKGQSLYRVSSSGSVEKIADAPNKFNFTSSAADNNITVSDDGNFIAYGLFGQGAFELWLFDYHNQKKTEIYSSSNEEIVGIKFSSDNKKLYTTVHDLSDMAGARIKNAREFNLETLKYRDINLSRGLSSSPLFSENDEKFIISVNTNPQAPIVGVISEQYPAELYIVEVNSGINTLLLKNTQTILRPIGWLNSSEIVYSKEIEGKTQYYKVSAISENPELLFVLDKVHQGLETEFLVNNKWLVFTQRHEPIQQEITSLNIISLDGSGLKQLDRQKRFLWAIGVTEKK